jgi:chorismate mutase
MKQTLWYALFQAQLDRFDQQTLRLVSERISSIQRKGRLKDQASLFSLFLGRLRMKSDPTHVK